MFTTLLLLNTLGCDNGIKPIGGPATGTDTNLTTSTATGTGTGTGTATGTGTGTSTTGDTGQALDCQADYTVFMPPAGGTCLTAPVSCGDVIFGTNEGGTAVYDRTYWEGAMSLGALTSEPADVLDGHERVFGFIGHEPNFDITVTIDSCVPLWASWRRKGELSDNWCAVDEYWDVVGHFIGSSNNQSYTFLNNTQTGIYNYELIVDSYSGAEGNFMLTVDCY